MPTMMTDRVLRAVDYALVAHAQQTYQGGPYIRHPLAVARYVSLVGGDEAAVIGAVCHDILEDCYKWISYQDLVAEIGEEAASISYGCTRREDWSYDRLFVHVRDHPDPRVRTVKACDMFHNHVVNGPRSKYARYWPEVSGWIDLSKLEGEQ